MLVFSDPGMGERIERIRDSGISLSDELPRGLNASENALIEAPEGTVLLLLRSEI
jgi:hypothetical protein